jgi:hypothetical protein
MRIRNSAALVISTALAVGLMATSVAAQNASSKSKSARPPVSRPVGTVPSDISAEAAEVVWLFHHNSTAGGLLHYINNSHADFKLSVQDVNYLKDIGISTDVVFAMIRTPQARERLLTFQEREPMHHVTHHPQQEQPQTALQNIDFRQNEPMDAGADNSVAPNSSAPAHDIPVQPVPQGHPFYGPGVAPLPGNGYDNRVLPPGRPGYNNGYYDRQLP